MQMALGDTAGAVEKRLAALEADHFAERMWRKDPSLWGTEAALRDLVARRLGWLDAPRTMKAAVVELEAFARSMPGDGFTHAVLLGMGGSSLAPEVLRLTFGAKAGALDLSVLDNTSPAAVRAVELDHDPRRTLFVVSSKSGGTIEVVSFEKRFFEWVRGVRADAAGRHFVAITDPGTPLQQLATRRGYRQVFTNPPDIGGRYSALSYFGLVPAALMGLDVGALLEYGIREAAACAPGVPAASNPALMLGAALGELALAGRNKLTLVCGPRFEAFGAWAEQLVAESTGKSGRGIVPVAEEDLGPPDVYGGDRVFVALSSEPLGDAVENQLDSLAAAGHPVLRWRDPEVHALGAEFLRWEMATAVAGAIIDVNPFDEPNVTEAKQATSAVLARYLESGQFEEPGTVAGGGSFLAEAPASIADELRRGAGDDPAAWVPALLSMAAPGDYLAVLAYMRRTPVRHERLQKFRHAVRAAKGLATTLGYGPRFLHSTGQLHKGGDNSGLFLQLTADEEPDVDIPGETYGFAALRWAQAAGDYEVLERRGRRVVRLRLGGEVEPALDRLIESVSSM